MDQLFGDNIFKLLFDNAAEGLIIVNREGDIVLNNPRAEEMFGYAEGELRQKPLSSLLPDHMGSKHSEYTNAYFTKPSKRMMGAGRDLQGKKKSGTLIPVEISLNHFAFEGETYAMALMTDITERKKSEGELNDLRKALEDQVVTKSKALEESQMLYREVARNFPNGTINVLDKNLNYVFAEGKELYKFGITSEKLVGTSYIGGLPSSVASDIEERLREVLAGNNQSFEITLDRGDYLVNSVALSSEEGISRILVVEQDITKQKRAEKEMKKALEKERELGELKSRFVSMASHEFRTPLSTILSSSTLALKYKLSDQIDKREKHLNRIQSSVKNLTSILNDFLSLSRLEEGRIQLNIADVNIEELVKDLIDELQELRKEGQSFDFKCRIKNKIVRSDENVMRNVFNNLISNAIKYSPENSLIKINCEDENGDYLISVSDQGIGIPEDEQMHLFDRFFRAQNVTNIQGTGLGLNIVKRYVNLLKGEISFTSKENEGTTFYIKLPKFVGNEEG